MLKDCARRRIPVPPPYDNPPSYGPEFGLYLWAFNELSRERDPSTIDGRHITVSRIKYKAIREWAEWQGYATDRDFMQELYALVEALDIVWVETEQKILKNKANKHGKPA